VVVLQAALVGFAWFAMETGEDQEEKVEKVVAERHIEEHEEAAERFFYIAIAAALVSAAGLLQAAVGRQRAQPRWSQDSPCWRRALPWGIRAASWSTSTAPRAPTRNP
jgi:hypothetical protein